MNKKILFAVLAFNSFFSAGAQTLFSFGGQPVEAKEFMRAYNKNNDPATTDKEKSIRDYLALYISSRLKVKEAYARGYDTLPAIKQEISNLRAQILENYMTETGLLDRFVKEAFERSQKDIRTGYIYIAIHAADTTAAIKKKDEVLAQLKKGKDFLQAAQQFSDDPSVKENKGDIGYITVFTLPYTFENIIYKTTPGKISEPARSAEGFHIFKNLGERKAAGKIKAQQILLAFPPGADDAAKKKIAGLADSLYKLLKAGGNFFELASTYSNDYVSAASGGTIPDVSVGQYDAAFENELWALKNDGDISKPFLTAHGWHIVKRLAVKPVVTDSADPAYKKELEQKIISDGRWKFADNFIYERVKQAGFNRTSYKDAALWAYTDSVLTGQPLKPEGKNIQPSSMLASIKNTSYDAAAWIIYAQANRFKNDGSGPKSYSQLREEWEKSIMMSYYRNNLEDFNDEFRYQMQEFKDGNLFFEIMQREIWNKAQADTAALYALYEKNKSSYTWQQSADAVVFFCTDNELAKTIYEEIKSTPGNWRKITEKYAESVIADSARYEWAQIPNLNKMAPAAGSLTSPMVNATDNTSSFAYIFTVYTQPMQRTFNEARGLVSNDYQALLDEEWNKTLAKKYPVKINEKVLKSLIKE